jgi:phage terminase small subunit
MAVRELEGTSAQVVAIPTTNLPAAVPEWLGDEARVIWTRVCASFPPGYFKACDENHLAGYCTATVLWIYATTRIQAGDDDPLIQKQRMQAHTERMQLGDRLGIGPARRTQSVAATSQAKKSAFFRTT